MSEFTDLALAATETGAGAGAGDFDEDEHPHHDHDHHDHDHEHDTCPAERILSPGDVMDISPTDESIIIVGTQQAKVTRITGLEGMAALKVRKKNNGVMSDDSDSDSESLLWGATLCYAMLCYAMLC